jgi:hypothetical protein
MKSRKLLLATALIAGVATRVGAADLWTPPIASRIQNVFLSCAIQNVGTAPGTARVQITEIPVGHAVWDTGLQTVAPGAGLTAGAIALVGAGPPDCTNGDCPCPNGPGQSCGHFTGTAACHFTVEKRKLFRAVGCISTPAQDPVTSPTCVEAR